jgi:hypothetical protein
MTRRGSRTAAMLVVVCAGGALAAMAAQEQWRPVVVRLPPQVPVSAVSACVTDDQVSALQPSTVVPGSVDALCGVTSLVRCSIDGTEPLDVPVATLCRGGFVRVEPAVRTLTPTWFSTAGSEGPVTVEWRAWGDSVSVLLATRVVDPTVATPLPLAAAARLVRVLRPGASPVTLIAPEAGDRVADLAVQVPAAASGGELLLFFDERERAMQTLTLQGPLTQLVGVNGTTFLSIPALPPGDYTLRYGTPDVPVGRPIDFRVREAETTELVPRLPAELHELRISGQVTFNGAPLSRHPLEVVHQESDDVLTVTTDDNGRYTILVPVAGAYVVRAVSEYDFGQLSRYGTVDFGETQIDLDLSGAHVRLTFLLQGGLPVSAVEFILEGPQRFSGITSDFTRPTELMAIPFGTYRVRASADPYYVAAVHPLVIDGTPGARQLTLDLQEQRASLRAVGPDGTVVAGTRARAGMEILRLSTTGTTGSFDIQRTAPGAEVIVRAPDHVPACVVLAPDVENLVMLQSATAALQVLFESETSRVPSGRVFLGGGTGFGCPVPLEEFEWRRIAGGFEILNLPSAVPVTLEYGTQRIPLLAPGEPVIVR